MAKSNKNSIVPVLIVLIILLLGGLGYLLYERSQMSKTNNELSREISDNQQITSDLELSFNEANDLLDDMKTDNVELNSIIEEQKIEIDKKRKQINRLITVDKNYAQARKEIAELQNQTAQYIAEIQKLKEENIELSSQNTVLKEEKIQLTKRVTETVEKNEELTEKTEKLSLYNEKLSKEREALNEKVNIASVIDIRDIEAAGYAVKNSGRLARRKRAKSADQITVCFVVEPNDVSQLTEEEFFMRIINPQGEVLSTESLGSGILVKEDDKESIKYTVSGSMEFKNEEKTVCMDWNPGLPFISGEYIIEIYNKGYLTGSTKLNFR